MSGPPSESRTLPPAWATTCRIGAARDRGERAAAFAALAQEAAEAGAAAHLLDRLLARGANGERFALEVASRLPPPLPAGHLPALVDLVESPRFPTRLRVPVAAQVIRSLPGDSPYVERVVETLRRRVAPARGASPGCGGWPPWSRRRPPCRGPWPSWIPARRPRARGAGPGSTTPSWSSIYGSGTGCSWRAAGSASRGT